MAANTRIPQAEITGILGAMAKGYSTASLVGCSFCLDLGYFQAHNDKLDMAKAREVPRWRESDAFTPLERDAFIAAANMVSRSNTALGIKAQGFSAACGLQPLATPSADSADIVSPA